MPNWFTKFWNFLKQLVTRPGLDRFLSKYFGVAVTLLMDLAAVHGNVEFHLWKDKAFAELKKITGELRDNWITILIALAFEELKAKKLLPPKPSDEQGPEKT